jgi:hypothetical protein
MPTEQQIEVVIGELLEIVDQLGYDSGDVIGPLYEPDAEDDEDEEEIGEASKTEESHIEETLYYLTASGKVGSFYIAFSTEYKYASVNYPLSIGLNIGSRLEPDEVLELSESSADWDDLEETEKDDLYESAGITIIENTPIESIWHPKFNISAYASTALVSYEETLTENGFPYQFRCNRGMFPYTEELTLKSIDDRISSVMIAGNRGKRYVDSSFVVDDSGDIDEYELIPQF